MVTVNELYGCFVVWGFWEVVFFRDDCFLDNFSILVDEGYFKVGCLTKDVSGAGSFIVCVLTSDYYLTV